MSVSAPPHEASAGERGGISITELPEVARLTLRGEEVYALTFPGQLSDEERERVCRQWECVMGRRKVLVLEEGAKLEIIANGPRARVLAEIDEERARQIKKWGVQDHASLVPVLMNRDGGCTPERMCEELEIPGETRAKFLCQNSNPDTFAAIAIEELSEAVCCLGDEAAMRTELVQLAAVVVAWVEAIDRRAKKGGAA